jgi:DNA-directed RNA polymerase specialized sigma24 family protein
MRFAAPAADVSVTYPNSPRPAPPEAFPDGLAGGEVRAALAALPPGMRAAVVLRHWLDLSVEETAALMNCSEGTVKSQTAKATARLRDLLSHAAVERTHP